MPDQVRGVGILYEAGGAGNRAWDSDAHGVAGFETERAFTIFDQRAKNGERARIVVGAGDALSVEFRAIFAAESDDFGLGSAEVDTDLGRTGVQAQ